MTIWIIKAEGKDENGGTVYRFWNRTEGHEVSIQAEDVSSAKKEYRKAFDLIGKSVKWVIT